MLLRLGPALPSPFHIQPKDAPQPEFPAILGLHRRSVVLFGLLGIWALIEMLLINRREGAWSRPDPVPLKAEIRPVVIGLVIFVVFLFAHPYLFGVSPIPT